MANKVINYESEMKESTTLTLKQKLLRFFNFKKRFQEYNWASWRKRNLSLNGLGRFCWIILRAVLLIGISFMILYPFIIKICVSFMSTNDIVDSTVMFIPREGSTYFLQRAIYNLNYLPALLMTTLVSLLVAIIQLIISCLVGYGFARFKFVGSKLLFGIVMMTLIVPSQTLLIPLYNTFSKLGILNTIWPVILLSACGIGLKNGLYIYLMRQHFRGLPKELEQSAYIDGAGPIKAFAYIMLPDAFNMMITVFLFSFTWQWTDTTYNSMLMPNVSLLTNTILKVSGSIEDEVQAGAVTDTATLLVILPLLIVFLFAQRYFMQSIERSGLVE